MSKDLGKGLRKENCPNLSDFHFKVGHLSCTFFWDSHLKNIYTYVYMYTYTFRKIEGVVALSGD